MPRIIRSATFRRRSPIRSSSSVDGKLYTIPEKFGYNTVAYNKAAVDPQAMTDINAIWDPKYKGRVAMYDYYVPMIEYVAIALGKKPADLTEADLPAIKDKLIALKANSTMIGDVVTVQQASGLGRRRYPGRRRRMGDRGHRRRTTRTSTT